MKETGLFYIETIYLALTKGVDDYVETPRRQNFYDNNAHLIAGTMLVGIFSYLESVVGKNWIDQYGGNFRAHLKSLKFIRNAFVHTNGNLRQLGSFSETKLQKLKDLISSLQSGNIQDEKGHVFPDYIALDQYDNVKLSHEACAILRGFARSVITKAYP